MDKTATRVVMIILFVMVLVLIPGRSNAINGVDQVFQSTVVTFSQTVTVTAIMTTQVIEKSVGTTTTTTTLAKTPFVHSYSITNTSTINFVFSQTTTTTVTNSTALPPAINGNVASWSGDAGLLIAALGLTGFLGLLLGYFLPSLRPRRQTHIEVVPKEADSAFGLTTDVGSRRENQDSAAIDYTLESRGQYTCRVVVADGVSGEAGGKLASSLAVRSILSATSDADDFREALQESVVRANQSILDYSVSKFGGQRLATTVVAAILAEDAVSIAHVGDSRAYLFHHGWPLRLTKDHTVTQQLLAERKITEAEAISHPDRHKLTKALGHKPTVEADVDTFTVTKGDILMLCTDGLTDGLSDAKIAEIVQGTQDMRSASKGLVQAAKSVGVQDNITVAIVRVD